MAEQSTATATAQRPRIRKAPGGKVIRDEKGGRFRLLAGYHVGPGPKGCQCDDCAGSNGKDHVYGPGGPNVRNPQPGPIIDSPDADLAERFNQPGAQKFERVDGDGRGIASAEPPAVPLEKLSIPHLIAHAEEMGIDLKGAAKKNEIVAVIRAALASQAAGG